MESISTQQVKAQILLTYGRLDNNIIKAASIGEIHVWGGKRYKKIAQGEWVRINETKTGITEKVVAQSGIKKVVQEEIDKHYKEYENVVSEFKKKWEAENGSDFWKIQVKAKYSRAQNESPEIQLAYNKYLESVKDLREDLKEVLTLNEIKAKQKREQIAGKKEIGTDDDYFKQNFDGFHQIFKQVEAIPEYCTAEEALGKDVTVDNYWLNTDAVFKEVYSYKTDDAVVDGVWTDPVEKKWKEMIDSSKYEFTQSPKSSSQYLVDKETGNVYRKADHWGRCASCDWDSELTNNYGIGVCNVKDFKRNYGGGYTNKERKSAEIAASKTILSRLSEMIKNDKIYFDKPANERIKNIINKVDSDYLRRLEIRLNEEVLKIKQDFKEVFEYNKLSKAFESLISN